MSINIHVLRASGRLEPFVSQIEKEFNEIVDKISKIMPVDAVDVVIYDNPNGAIPKLGIGGYTPNSYLVEISIDPELSNVGNSIVKQFKRTLAHELHHTLRWKNPGYGETLLEALITEGLADRFDMEINNALPQAWDEALDEKQIIEFLKLAEKEYFIKNYCYPDWFFGSVDGKIPRWTGYSLGFYLVDEYLKKHLDKKASMLYDVKVEEFLK